MNNLKQGENFTFEVDNETSDVYIKIIDGEYEGTKYLYGNVNFDESEDKEEVIYAELDFNMLHEVRNQLPCLTHRKLG